MLLRAGVRLCAPSLRLCLRGAGRCHALLLTGKHPGVLEPGQRSVAALCRPRVGGRGAPGCLSAIVGSEQIPSFHVQPLRCFSTSSLHEDSEHGRLVYRGNLAKAVLGVKFFSYTTSMFSLGMIPIIFYKTGVAVDNLPLQVMFYSVIGFFTFVTPVTLHLITKGYIIRLYHKPETDTYTAITYNAILAEKKTVFHQKDVKVPSISKMFTSFYAKTKSMLVNPMLFQYPQDYNHLMGYDKPFDFEESKESSEGK